MLPTLFVTSQRGRFPQKDGSKAQIVVGKRGCSTFPVLRVQKTCLLFFIQSHNSKNGTAVSIVKYRRSHVKCVRVCACVRCLALLCQRQPLPPCVCWGASRLACRESPPFAERASQEQTRITCVNRNCDMAPDQMLPSTQMTLPSRSISTPGARSSQAHSGTFRE